MGRFCSLQAAAVAATIFILLLLPACGGHKPAGASPFPAKITLNPSISTSMQLGSTMVFTASATNGSNTAINPTFTFSLAPGAANGILDISPAGAACAGTWNAPYYSVCTPGASGEVGVVATALGSTSAPTLVFVHPPIDEITVSLMPPVNPPPPACPGQQLPLACDLPFNSTAANYCVSQNQVQTLQARAFSQGTEITSEVGPFTFSQTNLNVLKITPIVSSTSSNIPTNQITIASSTPGATEIVASASGVTSQPYFAETCPVQCIALQLGSNGTQGTTSFVTTKGTNETITATAVDVQGCIVKNPALTWTSSAPAALTAGSGSVGCGTGSTCSIATTQPGAAAITASCTPPNCNVGFPLNPAGYSVANSTAIYIPEPVYPLTAISGLVTGPTTAASVFATSQDCYSNAQCAVALYDISTTSNVASNPNQFPAPPNSLLFDPAGDKAYAGSQYGSALITTANIGSSSTSPFTSLPAAGTPTGLVTGKVIGVSPNGNLAVFSDTVSIPNQVYVVNTTGSGAATTPLNINSATYAAFSTDSSKAFIFGNGGNTLYIYSALQGLQTIALTAPADAIAFSSSGAFAFIAGGSSMANITVLNTCNNLPATATATGTFAVSGLPATPLFLRMVPPGSAPVNAVIPALSTAGLDFFIGIDNAGIDVFATTATPLTLSTSSPLCPQQTLANASIPGGGTFAPKYINLNRGTFHPVNFFLSPDGDLAYIVTSDQGVLVYDFSTQSVSAAIPLIGEGNPAPIAADMTVDGTLLYVAGTDGLLHELNTQLQLDEMQIAFPELPDSSNNFCYSSFTCSLNIVAIKP
jgi:hypothetical protein